MARTLLNRYTFSAGQIGVPTFKLGATLSAGNGYVKGSLYFGLHYAFIGIRLRKASPSSYSE